MGILEKRIIEINNKINYLKTQILELEELKQKEINKLEDLKQSLGVDIQTCDVCNGRGKCLDRSGYGGCDIDWYECHKCNGNGFIIIEKR